MDVKPANPVELTMRPYRNRRPVSRLEIYLRRIKKGFSLLFYLTIAPFILFVFDQKMRWGAGSTRILKREVSGQKILGRRVVFYVHYMRSGRVTVMVRRQLEEYVKIGFDVIFITMSEKMDQADWDSLADICYLRIQRRNYGRDFGAWADILPEVCLQYPNIDEILLVNDSILGPIRSLDPLFLALRDGPGFSGLTESFQNGLHLQSYFLLINGAAAISDLILFFNALELSIDKKRMIRRGEVAITKYMMEKGHSVRVLYSTEMLENSTVNDEANFACLRTMFPGFLSASLREKRDFSRLETLFLFRLNMFNCPVNPTHNYWNVLVKNFNFPFIKTELIQINPSNIPDVSDWVQLVDENSVCSVNEIMQHLVEAQRR